MVFGWIIVKIVSSIQSTRLVVFEVDDCKDIVNQFEDKIDGICVGSFKHSVKYFEHLLYQGRIIGNKLSIMLKIKLMLFMEDHCKHFCNYGINNNLRIKQVQHINSVLLLNTGSGPQSMVVAQGLCSVEPPQQ